MNDKEWFFPKSANRPNRGFIWNETYKQGCIILWPVTHELMISEFSRFCPDCEIDDEVRESLEVSSAKFIYYKNLQFIVFRGKPTPALAAHEVFHWMAYTLIRYLGIPVSNKSEEAHAYFMGWAVERILSMVRNKK